MTDPSPAGQPPLLFTRRSLVGLLSFFQVVSIWEPLLGSALGAFVVCVQATFNARVWFLRSRFDSQSLRRVPYLMSYWANVYVSSFVDSHCGMSLHGCLHLWCLCCLSWFLTLRFPRFFHLWSQIQISSSVSTTRYVSQSNNNSLVQCMTCCSYYEFWTQTDHHRSNNSCFSLTEFWIKSVRSGIFKMSYLSVCQSRDII